MMKKCFFLKIARLPLTQGWGIILLAHKLSHFAFHFQIHAHFHIGAPYICTVGGHGVVGGARKGLCVT